MHLMRDVGHVVLAVMILTACGGNGSTGSLTQRFQAGLPEPFDLQCKQVALVLPVDPATAAQYLPRPGTDLLLNEQGSAQLMLGLKSCPHFAAGDAEYGPLSFYNVWLLIQGPYEVNPVPGTAFTLPTIYTETLKTYFDDKEFVQYIRELGAEIRQAKYIEVGNPGDPGLVYEMGDVGFSWQESLLTAPLGFPVGFNLTVHRDQDRIPAIEHITCEAYGLTNGHAAVSVNSPDSFLAPFGTEFDAGTTDMDMHCSVHWTPQ